MRAVAALLALLLALAAASCSNRERANPLDAANPNTGGAPQGFNAIAYPALVQLNWVAQPGLAIDGFEIFRLAPGETIYQSLCGVLPSSSSQFYDNTVQPGLEYHYRIHYVVGGVVAAVWAEDVAMPGPLSPWVVDPGRGLLARLSPDGRDVLASRPGFTNAGGLAVTRGLGAVWVGDEIDGTLDIVYPSDLLGPHLRGLGAPAGIALDPLDATAWICNRNGDVKHYRSDGTVASPAALLNLDDPVAIATDPGTGEIWVTEFGGSRLRHYDHGGLPSGARPLLAPSRVAVDSTTGEAWVTSISSGWLWRVSRSLVVLDSLRYQSPVGVALDWRRRVAWICDVDANQLVALNMDTRAEKFRVNGLGNPWDVAVNLGNGEAWVVARGSGRAYRLSPTGQTITFVPGFGDPYSIRLDPGP